MAEPLSVLIVEDSDSDAQLIVRMLTKAGYILTFERVETAEQMREALKQQAWEVVISDFAMPELDGNAALKILLETGLDIPFIVVSGTMGEDTAVAMMKAGAQDYLMKGKLARLVPAVERELRQAEERRERKQEEKKSLESRILFETVVENIPLMLFLKESTDLRFVLFNRAGEQLLGYDRQVLLGKNNLDLFPPEQAAHFMTKDREVLDGQAGVLDIPEEPIMTAKNGQRLLHTRKVCIRGADGEQKYLLGISEDITERKQAERYIKDIIDKNPMSIQVLDNEGFTLETNPAYKLLFGSVPPPDYSIFNDLQLVQKGMGKIFGQLRNGEVVHFPEVNFNPHDSISELPDAPVWVRTIGFPIFDNNDKPFRLILMHENITERKQLEENRDEAEHVKSELIKKMNESQQLAMVGSWDWDLQTNQVWWSDETYQIFGVTPQEYIPSFEGNGKFIHPDDFEKYGKAFEHSFQTGEPLDLDLRLVVKEGILKHCQFKGMITYDDSGQPVRFIGTIMDITERTKAEEMLIQAYQRLSLAQHSSRTGLWDWDIVTGKLEWSPELFELFGLDTAPNPTFDVWRSVLHPDDVQLAGDRIDQSIREHKSLSSEYRIFKPSGEMLWILALGDTIYDEQGEPKRISGICIDITERKLAEQKIQRQYEHLNTLSEIDRVISTNFNLEIILSEILTHATKELEVDAADILLFDLISGMLKFAAKNGFNSKSVNTTQLRIGESYAGRAAHERKLIHIADLRTESDTELLKSIAADDNFICYFGVPLINKGKVIGVLEVFHRKPLEPDVEWLHFLNSLADLAAIAIENVSLFEKQQRTNQELTMAYDATIEGWSCAMDLRDKETEGHTQRVTDVTLKLAGAFGLTNEELMQVRWGALLHDIGKMGVPDGILLKPGPLTDEEWVVMKKHPTYAYEMLSPIHYLRQALDIPYCHHEKWDGSGYPQGLKGNQIPLPARIFALVDVWDALRSDRPYRTAWPDEKAYEHIRSLSGTHFDPQVVEKFLLVHG
jgi:PAS domain S-box-containing protein/putative nucleotidyltransferase with HDIG domain